MGARPNRGHTKSVSCQTKTPTSLHLKDAHHWLYDRGKVSLVDKLRSVDVITAEQFGSSSSCQRPFKARLECYVQRRLQIRKPS